MPGNASRRDLPTGAEESDDGKSRVDLVSLCPRITRETGIPQTTTKTRPVAATELSSEEYSLVGVCSANMLTLEKVSLVQVWLYDSKLEHSEKQQQECNGVLGIVQQQLLVCPCSLGPRKAPS